MSILSLVRRLLMASFLGLACIGCTHAAPPDSPTATTGKSTGIAELTKEALKDAEQQVSDRPKSALAHLLRGEAHAYLGNDEAAISDFRKSMELDKDDLEPRLELLKVLARTGKLKATDTDDLLKKHPDAVLVAEFMKDEKSMVANRELDEAVWHIWRRRIEPSVRERLAAKPEQAAKRMMLLVMSPTAEDVQRDRITKELALLDKPGIEAVETVQKLIRRMIFLRITAYGDAYKKTLEEFAYTEVTIPFDIADYSRKHLKYHNSLEAWTIRALKELEVARSNSPSVQAELKATLPKQDPEIRKHTLKLVEMAEADLKKNPDNYAALQLRSMTHDYCGDFAEALNDIELARQLAPANIGNIMRFEQLRYLRAMNRDKDADALDDAIMNDSPAAAFYLISLADGKELREALAVDETIQTMLMDRPNATIRKLFAANPGIAAKRLSAYLMLPKLDAEWQKRIEAELKELGQVAVDHLKDQRKQLTGARVNLVEDEFDREKARRQRQLSQVLELAVERIDRILNR